MYAVIETGGKQYRVEVGTELEIELLEAGPGESVAFERVLLVADGDAASIGHPVVANASVSAEVLRRDRGEKLISFKYRPKASRRVKKGHRQELTVVRVSDIVLDGKSAAAAVAKAEEARKTERQRLEEAARAQAAQDAALAAKLAADKAKADAEADEKAAPKGKASGKAPAKASGKAPGRATATTGAKGATKATSSKAAKADTTESEAQTTRTSTSKSKASDAAKPTRTRKSDED
jgi:large subunit ribosomal protein L21